MRNYIILNDVNSNTINGLLIQELPPISKPKMRTQIEEIDGRAGDIVTQLGYAAYTKTISVGLYGNFDINEVISYFNSSGTVVFSNEPDKYYNYEIIDQIDFNRLVRFRTAKVKMHVQPFKYPTEEEPLVAQYQLVTNTGSNMSLDNTANALFRKLDLKGNTSQTGTPTPDAPVNVDVVSGDNVLSICGKNLLEIPNGTYTSAGNEITAIVEDGVITLNGTATATRFVSFGLFFTLPKGTYSIKANPPIIGASGGSIRLATTDVAVSGASITFASTSFNTFTTTEDLQVGLQVRTASGVSYNNFVIKPQLEVGNQATEWEVYNGETYPINLPVVNMLNATSNEITLPAGDNSTPTIGQVDLIAGITYYISYEIENDSLTNTRNTPQLVLDGTSTSYYESANTNYNITKGRKLWVWTCPTTGTYNFKYWCHTPNIQVKVKDFMITDINCNKYWAYGTTPIELCKIGDNQDYIYKENNKWLLHKEIGKVVLTGSSSEGWALATAYTNNTRYNSSNVKLGKTTPLISNYFVEGTGGTDTTNIDTNGTTGQLMVTIPNSIAPTKDDLTAWLGTHNTAIYYVLDTPTATEITDEDLIAQLEALKQANSYDGQTNISHQYNGSPFILDVAAVQKGSDILVVDNEGNIYSRPTLDIEGTGIVDIYLEGNQMFQVDLSENNEIVIDTDEMEAYDPNTQALMNRQVTGNYDNFKIVAGNNNLKFSGDLTKATVTNYERWL